MAEVLKRLVNRDEYFRMAEVGMLTPNDRVELLNGEIYEMSPVGSRHSSVVKKLAKILHDMHSANILIGVQDHVNFNQYNQPEPDISVLKYRSDFYADQHPQPADTLLLIEVADSSITFDRDTKLPLYAEHDIPEYWIVDLKIDTIMIFQEPSGVDYAQRQVYTAGHQVPMFGELIKVSTILNL